MRPDEEPTQERLFDLYKILVDENRHLHKVWVDNLRALLTFNSILLAGAFALLSYSTAKSESITDLNTIRLSVQCISLLGTVASISIFLVIRRIAAIIDLRIAELRYIESTHLALFPVRPFEEGAVVLGSKNENYRSNLQSQPYQVKILRSAFFTAIRAYMLVCAALVIAHVAIFVFSVNM